MEGHPQQPRGALTCHVYCSLDRLDWEALGSNTTRLLKHIADAPCHGTHYHTVDDSYPDGDPHGLSARTYVTPSYPSSQSFTFLASTAHGLCAPPPCPTASCVPSSPRASSTCSAASAATPIG